MTLPEPTFLNFILGGVLLYLLRAAFLLLRRWWRILRARHHLNRYHSEREAYYSTTTNTKPTADRYSQNPAAADYVKDKDTKVQDIAEPKGFWTRFVMNEKIHLIREMIKISNSGEHRGYWQDRVEAQKRVEGKRQVGEDIQR